LNTSKIEYNNNDHRNENEKPVIKKMTGGDGDG
jgi:hypothetical protein